MLVAGGEMNVHFTSNIKSFDEINPDPTKDPLLYRSGYKSFTLSPSELAKVREYVLNGGTVVFNSLVGNPDAYQSALAAAKAILPERDLYRLRMDHPVFHSFYNIDKVAFRDRMMKDGMVVDPYPFLEGMDVDNRTAIIISRWDFSLGWRSQRSR